MKEREVSLLLHVRINLCIVKVKDAARCLTPKHHHNHQTLSKFWMKLKLAKCETSVLIYGTGGHRRYCKIIEIYLIESFAEFHPGEESSRQLSTLQLANFSGLQKTSQA